MTAAKRDAPGTKQEPSETKEGESSSNGQPAANTGESAKTEDIVQGERNDGFDGVRTDAIQERGGAGDAQEEQDVEVKGAQRETIQEQQEEPAPLDRSESAGDAIEENTQESKRLEGNVVSKELISEFTVVGEGVRRDAHNLEDSVHPEVSGDEFVTVEEDQGFISSGATPLHRDSSEPEEAETGTKHDKDSAQEHDSKSVESSEFINEEEESSESTKEVNNQEKIVPGERTSSESREQTTSSYEESGSASQQDGSKSAARKREGSASNNVDNAHEQ